MAGGARGDADGASGTRVLNKLNSGGIEHGLGKSRNRKLTKFVLRGPLSAQPVERPRDARFPCTSCTVACRILALAAPRAKLLC